MRPLGFFMILPYKAYKLHGRRDICEGSGSPRTGAEEGHQVHAQSQGQRLIQPKIEVVEVLIDLHID